VSSESKSLSRFNETVLTILHCGIHPISSAPAILSRFNETVLTPPALSSMPIKSAWPPYPPGALLAVVSSKCTLVKCTSLPRLESALLTPESTSPPSPLLSSKSTSLLLVHPSPPSSPPRPECCLSPPSALLFSSGEKKWNFPSLAICVKHTLRSHLRSPSASLRSTE